jgi:hypothetical protein
MTSDPFEMAEPIVVDLAEGSMGTCPCGWRSDVLHKGRRAAQQDLEAHLRKAHPERSR